MRKLLSVIFLAAAPSLSFAASGSVTLINEVVAATQTYAQNLNAFGGQGVANKLSAQVTSSSATYATKTFTDGTQSTGSITVLSNNILARAATDQIRIPASVLAAPATAQIVVVSTANLGTQASMKVTFNNASASGTVLAITGSPGNALALTVGTDFPIGGNTTTAAANFAAVLNTLSDRIGMVASSAGNVVFATTTLNTTGAGYSIVSSSPPLVSTAAFTGGSANAVITINGNPLRNGIEWVAVPVASMTALSIAGAMNTYLASALISTAPSGSATVYTTATATGDIGNGYTLTSSVPGSISTGSLTQPFSGGHAAPLAGQTITFNGSVGVNGLQWTDADGTSSGTAASVAAWLESLGGVSASTGASNVVFATAAVGAAGNAYTLAASTTNIVIASALFKNGQDNATVTVNGKTFTAGVDFSTGSLTTTAINLANVINAASSTIGVNASTGAVSTTVVFCTSTVIGLNTNFAMASSTQGALSLSQPRVTGSNGSTNVMTGGADPAFSLASATITVTGHGFTTALPVLYTQGAVAITGLVDQTTYYVIPVGANSLQLALSSTGAVAGLGVVLNSSSTQTTGHTYTLAPLAFVQGQGASARWQVSNDGINWANFTTTQGGVAVSSQTFTPSGITTTMQDFGPVGYSWIRYNVLGPTSGGITLKVILNAKD